jgi:hypothetical protein
MTPLFIALGLLACTPSKPSLLDSTDLEDLQTVDTANEVDAADLKGEQPDGPLAAPEFTVLNHDSSSRTREDLLGHRTVMWFFPFAMSPG